MDLNNFKRSLLHIYSKFPEFKKSINNVSKEYLLFLYFHLTDGIKIIITDNPTINKDILHIKNITCDKQYCKVLIMMKLKY
jgi:hypothetical protein